MIEGLSGGILWALDTVILGIALAGAAFTGNEQALFLAPFVSTFLHDLCSSVWLLLYLGAKRRLDKVLLALRSRSGKYIILGALLGGPVGMSGYVAAIRLIGPAYTAVISSLYPALGALLSYFFLKETMSRRQIAGLAVCLAGVIGLNYTSGRGAGSLLAGFGCALLCVLGWASEGVLCAYGMKDPEVGEEQALQLRQLTSAVFYGVMILPVLSGWRFTLSLIPSVAAGTILLAALSGTASYLMYYKAIHKMGPAKAMALNITYTAWAFVFELIFFGNTPGWRSVCCAILVVGGSLTAARNASKGR